MPSLAASLAALALVAQASAHVSLVAIYGSNGAVGHGFGVNLYGKYPREKGIPGDAGGDSGVFQTGTDNPSPPCGRTPELGPIDIPAWLDQAEGSGLPAAYANMSVVVDAFQVNRDGGGPMSCEYNEDATATSWKPMFMSLNQAGNSGIQNQVRSNETVVMNFPEGAQCTGGWTQSACIVRCRTGVNKRFGGCFAVKLSGSSSAAVSTSLDVDLSPEISIKTVAGVVGGEDTNSTSVVPLVNPTLELTDEQISSIAEQVIIQMKKEGLILAASAAPTGNISAVSNLNTTSLSEISQAIQLDPNSTESTGSIADANQSANLTTSASNSSLDDASDAEDDHLYNITSKSNVSAIVASHIVDNQVYNLTSPVIPSTPKPKHHKSKNSRRCTAHKRKS
ncbi:hypothetical protein PGT21_006083 [Puccinia graminis f. sp. tritici]|uniref:Uncharacterized protein n=1 Tax=Puccinia graminis f. sp. tritici TaxID=56615 RepID=A0A5B0LMS2_PUCGR|nr:hypothetical protein PGT21_006083 [Puccinia graminis f. sp. tritici]KAA1080062.1 hypothetical protein PGTUg99_025800 [Puccinia graminis f. sp. tritici]